MSLSFGISQKRRQTYILEAAACSYPIQNHDYCERFGLGKRGFEFGYSSRDGGGESSYHFDLQSCIKLGAKTRVVRPLFSDAGRIFPPYDV